MLFHLKNPSNPDKWIYDWGFVSLFLRLSYLTLASYPPTLLCTESFNLHSKVLRCADSPPIKSLYTPLQSLNFRSTGNPVQSVTVLIINCTVISTINGVWTGE